jgi:hypothetical protein
VGRGKTVVIEVRGPLAPGDGLRLCERVRIVLQADATTVVVCELRSTDLEVVDVLARMHHAARCLGGWLEMRGDLELLELTGLAAVLAPKSEPGGEAEAREQVGVQEVMDVGDPAG